MMCTLKRPLTLAEFLSRPHASNLNQTPIFSAQDANNRADSFLKTLATAYSAPHAVFCEGTIVKRCLAVCMAVFFAFVTPALAQDSMRGLAPADEYFGHYKLSVLGIANTIRDAGTRIDSGSDPRNMLTGPLSYVTDAIRDWQQQYPGDPWIARDLLALETVYLRVPTDEGFRLASQTAAWLVADFANTEYAAKGRDQLADNRIPYMPQQQPQQAWQPPQQAWQPPAQPPYQPAYQPVYQPVPQVIVVQPVRQVLPSYAIPWERFAAMRTSYRMR